MITSNKSIIIAFHQNTGDLHHLNKQTTIWKKNTDEEMVKCTLNENTKQILLYYVP